ncbi:MAG: L7Ae/L30e/S12e/Gadd45 family ribosomal protein [Oscillospiraceae bacterium]
MDKLLNLIGLAQKAGRLAVGEEPTGAAARARDARLILVAADAAENSVRRVRHFADAGQCLWCRIGADKDALGRAVGRLELRDAGGHGHRLCRGHRQKARRGRRALCRNGGEARGQGPARRRAAQGGRGA